MDESQKRDIIKRFKRVRGFWDKSFDYVIKHDYEFFECYERLANHPWNNGVLDPKVKELILLAVNASTTHLNVQAVRQHIINALNRGATKEEIAETLELTAVLGIHSITTGLPILIGESGLVMEGVELTERQREIMEKFKKERGYWSEALWGSLLRLDPEYLDKYTDYSGHPWRHGPLPPKIKELIYIAIDAATTHLYEPGLRQHIQNALKHGAKVEEILEVLELVVELGFQTCTLGFKILDEEFAKKKRKKI